MAYRVRTYCPIFLDTFWALPMVSPADRMNMDAVGRALIDCGAFSVEAQARLANDAEEFLNARVMS